MSGSPVNGALTVDFGQLDIGAGTLVLDVGCGSGRHSFEAYRRGADVVALDRDPAELAAVQAAFAAMRELGRAPAGATATVVIGDAREMPYQESTFDVVIAAEVLDHIAQDDRAVAELVRVLKPGGVLVVTVGRWLPEHLCGLLSRDYRSRHDGPVRVYRADVLRDEFLAYGMRWNHTHHAHALEAPYWWLKCAGGLSKPERPALAAYHRMLQRPPGDRPWLGSAAERVLNPLIGKAVAMYFRKPVRAVAPDDEPGRAAPDAQ